MAMFAGSAGAVAGNESALDARGSASGIDSYDASASIPPLDGFADEDEEELEDEKDEEDEKDKGPPDHAENDDEEGQEKVETDDNEKGPPDHAKNDDEAGNDPEEDAKVKQPDKETKQKRDEQAPPEQAQTEKSDGDEGSDSTTTGDEGTAENAKDGQQQKQAPPHQENAEDKPIVSVTTERSVDSDDSGGADDGASNSDDQRNQDDAEDSGGEPSTVNVKVDGVDAGERLELGVKTEETEDDEVAFDGISTTVKRGGSFTMRITSSREALPGSPAFDTEDGAEPIGRIRLEHSITNDEVEDVSFTFRVSKQRLIQKGIAADDVALYRHADGSWSALPSKVVGETTTHYVLTADSPGMSEFAIGAKRPSFELWDAGVTLSMVQVGEPTKIFGKVTNVGGADGVFTARLNLDGETVATRHLTIAAGGTRQVSFERPLAQPGRYELYVNDVHAGSVLVELPEESKKRGAAAVLFDWLPDLGLALGILGLITPAALVTLRSRRWF